MSLSDPIGDMIVRIKNAQVRNHKKLELPSSNFKVKIADVLKNEGFIIDYKINKKESNKADLMINLKYNAGSPVISTIERTGVSFVEKITGDYLERLIVSLLMRLYSLQRTIDYLRISEAFLLGRQNTQYL